jgi:hypothetical protein
MALRDIGTSPNYVSFRQQRTLSNSKLHSHRRPLLYKGSRLGRLVLCGQDVWE